MTTTVPTPKSVFGSRKAPALPPAPKPLLVAPVVLDEPGSIVRPGLVDEIVEGIHDGVVKAKHLRKGQRVRPWVKDRKTGEWAPRGSERVVASTERIQSGAIVRITWATPHSPEEQKAAYRFHDASLVGTIKQDVVRKPGFVAYKEV